VHALYPSSNDRGDGAAAAALRGSRLQVVLLDELSPPVEELDESDDPDPVAVELVSEVAEDVDCESALQIPVVVSHVASASQQLASSQHQYETASLGTQIAEHENASSGGRWVCPAWYGAQQ
jgi:hypothetical protein